MKHGKTNLFRRLTHILRFYDPQACFLLTSKMIYPLALWLSILVCWKTNHDVSIFAMKTCRGGFPLLNPPYGPHGVRGRGEAARCLPKSSYQQNNWGFHHVNIYQHVPWVECQSELSDFLGLGSSLINMFFRFQHSMNPRFRRSHAASNMASMRSSRRSKSPALRPSSAVKSR